MKLFWNQGSEVSFRSGSFYGRDGMLTALHRVAAMGRYGEGGSVLLHGRPNIGKTSLLLKFKEDILLEKNRPIEGKALFPFYFSFSRVLANPFRLAYQYILEYMWQFLGFLGEAPRGGYDAQALGERLVARGYAVPFEQIEGIEKAVEEKDGVSAIAMALTFPFTFEKEEIGDVFIMDDFHYTMRLTDMPEWVVLSLLRPYIKSGTYPIIISGSSPGLVTANLKKEGLFGSFNMLEVGSLERKSAREHVEDLLSRRKYSLPPKLLEILVTRLGGVPVYQKLMVDDLVFRGVEVKDESDLENLYGKSIVEGTLNRYWREFFESCFPERRVLAKGIKFLKRVLVDRFPIDTYEGALGLIGGDPSEGEEILSALEFKGLVKADYDMLSFLQDRVLSDFLFWAYERAVLKKPNDQVIARIVEKNLFRSHFPQPEDVKTGLLDSIKSLLRSWDCQEIPATLFDYTSFRDRYGKMGALEVVLGVGEEKIRFHLPKISSVSTGYMVGGKLPRVDFDVVAFGFRNKEYTETSLVIWSVDVFPGPLLDKEKVEHFENRCRLLALEKALAKEQLVKWIIFEGKVSEDALSYAASTGIFVTHRKQLKILQSIFGIDEEEETGEGEGKELQEGKESAEGPLEFDLVIPMREDTEVIAARVTEEISYFREIDKDSMDRVKMAIIEACINAFEHSGDGGGQVKLRYLVDGERLEITVSDEGKGFREGKGPLQIRDPKRPRGWGLKIIKELVDEVDVVTGDGGTVVRMVKYLDPPSREKETEEPAPSPKGEEDNKEGGSNGEET